MSKLSFKVVGSTPTFSSVPVGKHVGDITSVEMVHTKPEKSQSPWEDASAQLAIKIKTDDGQITFYQPTQGFVRADDKEDIQAIFDNMPKERLDLAKIKPENWNNPKKMSFQQKFDAMFDAVDSDKYDSAKAKYIVFKHGAKVRVESATRTERDIMPIIGRIPVTLGLCEAGDEFDVADLVGESVGIEVVEGPNGKNKVKYLMSVADASA